MNVGEDVSIFFDDFAQDVTALGETFINGGLLDAPSEIIGSNGDVLVTDYQLYVRTDQLGKIRMGDVLDIGGVRFRARADARPRDDGRLALIALQRVRNVDYVEGGEY